MYSNYQDEFGLIHLRENPPLDDSENTPLFNSASYLLFRLNGTSTAGMKLPDYSVFYKNGNFHTYPNGDDNRFSHDNMTGMYIAKELKLHNIKLPIARWDSYTRDGAFERKYWLHPRDLIFYSALQGNLVGLMLLPLLLLISITSYLAPSTSTSGKCLWFYRFGILSLSRNPYKELIGELGLVLGELLMKREHGSQAFIDVFDNYYKDPNHPVRIEIRKWYDS